MSSIYSPVHALPKIQIGDYVPQAGIYTNPGVVIDKKANGEVVVDTSPEAINRYQRYAITTGLTPEDKDMFNGIMDEVMKDGKSDSDRINELQQIIDELKHEPQMKPVAQTLKNQQLQLIRMAKDLPRIYEVSADSLR